MLIRGVSCLPVTTNDGVIQGVVTWKDVFRAFLDSNFSRMAPKVPLNE